MSAPIELPKLPIAHEAPLPEREALPYSSVPLAGSAAAVADRAATAREMSDFEAYLNRRSILRLARYKGRAFDAAAEILCRSVYKPIKFKSGR